jgi:hypothetical protein
MKQDAEALQARVAQLESELAHERSDSAATEKNLQKERDYHMNEAERYRTAYYSTANEREKFRAEANDLTRLLDRERRNRLVFW